MSAAAFAAEAGSVALNANVSQSRTGSGPLAARAAQKIGLAETVDAGKARAIELVQVVGQVLLELCG